MSQLYASSAKKISLYFKDPSTLHEHFVNKKWIERTNICQSKQSFIKTAIESWSNSTDEERLKYLSPKAAPKNRTIITNFFSTEKENISNFRRSSKLKKNHPHFRNLPVLQQKLTMHFALMRNAKSFFPTRNL